MTHVIPWPLAQCLLWPIGFLQDTRAHPPRQRGGGKQTGLEQPVIALWAPSVMHQGPLARRGMHQAAKQCIRLQSNALQGAAGANVHSYECTPTTGTRQTPFSDAFLKGKGFPWSTVEGWSSNQNVPLVVADPMA